MKIDPKTTLLFLLSISFAVSGAELSPETGSKILKRFPKADRDGDGKLSETEFATVQKQIIKKHPKADADGDGKLSNLELMNLAKTLKKRNSKASKNSNKPEATHANVKYGENERHVLDIWIADTADNQPAPLALYIHGGGFGSGSKEKMSEKELDELLKAGVSVAAINYRYKQSDPLPAAFHDCRQALQFIRSKASEWNVDKEKVAVWGSSAGAQICMWLAYSDEMANPTSSNPIERESTRVTCVATKGGQTTMEEKFWTEHVQRFGGNYDPQHRLGLYGVESLEEANETAISLAALTLISKDDPPIFMSYGMTPDAKAPAIDHPSAQGWVVHHVVFGTELQKKTSALNVESHLIYPGVTRKYQSHVKFMVEKLKSAEKSNAAK